MHGKSDRASSGSGKLKSKIRDKRRSESGGYFASSKVAEKGSLYKIRARGGNRKDAVKYATFANVLTKQGYKKAKITGVVESNDNRNFARLAIITKGAVINTELGKARVTNRPGQEGGINAMLIEG
ncbi:MAG: 30S ribosomal protein S8e [Candidatus Micrarchaeota archaeon]|nr:30S ribosomal protein S8e [Candidatus Micrarchaeota archaeon]